MLSNSSKYAIKAVLFIAIHATKENKVMVKDISKPINVPQAYIAKLLQPLVKQHIVSSIKGPKGGFFLEEDNLNKSILSIISVIDGVDWLHNCMLSLDKCHNEKPCPLHDILSPSRNKIIENLKNKSIKDLMLSVEAGNSFLPL
jgi:Rrf2 family transcriptional regulator, iron-sulfur cluster assembly transcription factor